MDWIQENLSEIEARIDAACLRVQRNPEEITLIAVSKTVDPEWIDASLNLGIKHLGENKPQEIVRKRPLVKGAAQWHMIGNLQSNKVKQIIDKVAMIHSVDSLRLAEEISKRALAMDRVMPILIQVNIGDESQKGGISLASVEKEAIEIARLPGVQVEGLMCIAPFLEDAEAVRPYFKRMKSLFEHLKEIEYNRLNMIHLSMGMTHDFEVAIEEGATMIRVGTGLYGARNY